MEQNERTGHNMARQADEGFQVLTPDSDTVTNRNITSYIVFWNCIDTSILRFLCEIGTSFHVGCSDYFNTEQELRSWFEVNAKFSSTTLVAYIVHDRLGRVDISISPKPIPS